MLEPSTRPVAPPPHASRRQELELRLLRMPPQQLLPAPGRGAAAAGRPRLTQLFNMLAARMQEGSQAAGAAEGQLGSRASPQRGESVAGARHQTAEPRTDQHSARASAKNRGFEEIQPPHLGGGVQSSIRSAAQAREGSSREAAAALAGMPGTGHMVEQAFGLQPQRGMPQQYTAPQQQWQLHAADRQASWTLAHSQRAGNSAAMLARVGQVGKQTSVGVSNGHDATHPPPARGSGWPPPGQPARTQPRQQPELHQRQQQRQWGQEPRQEQGRQEEDRRQAKAAATVEKAAPSDGAPPAKRRRGRPRIYPPGQSPSALKRKMYKGTGRPRGRPRKHPKPPAPPTEAEAQSQ